VCRQQDRTSSLVEGKYFLNMLGSFASMAFRVAAHHRAQPADFVGGLPGTGMKDVGLRGGAAWAAGS
jgi:hypothetical protein